MMTITSSMHSALVNVSYASRVECVSSQPRDHLNIQHFLQNDNNDCTYDYYVYDIIVTLYCLSYKKMNLPHSCFHACLLSGVSSDRMPPTILF